jgi:hypothetical protein
MRGWCGLAVVSKPPVSFGHSAPVTVGSPSFIRPGMEGMLGGRESRRNGFPPPWWAPQPTCATIPCAIISPARFEI